VDLAQKRFEKQLLLEEESPQERDSVLHNLGQLIAMVICRGTLIVRETFTATAMVILLLSCVHAPLK